MPSRCIVWLALLSACAPPGPASSDDADVAAEAPCDGALLAGFEPGSLVASRRPLPATAQLTQAVTEHHAAVPCPPEESNEDCLQRVRRTSKAEYPAAASIEAQLEPEEPPPDVDRLVRVKVSMPAKGGELEVLRAELVLAPTDSPVQTVVALRERARAARVAIHTVEPQPDGSVVAEIGCVRPRAQPAP